MRKNNLYFLRWYIQVNVDLKVKVEIELPASLISSSALLAYLSEFIGSAGNLGGGETERNCI